MKARKWFFALGQSHEARRMPYALCVAALKLNALPHWVKQAYSAGRLSVMHGGFGKRISAQIEFVRNLPAEAVRADDAAMAAMRKALAVPEHLLTGSEFTVHGLEAQMRVYDPEATVSLGAEVNSVDVLTTLHPQIVQDMVPLGVKVNQRYRGAVPMVRIEQVLVR